MIVLGIDPGLNTTGWGVIQVEGSSLSYFACGTVKSHPKASLPQRIEALHTGLTEILERYQPQEAGMEETFMNTNAASSLKLGHARGALMLTVAMKHIPLAEYSALKVKKSLTGVGKADKAQVMHMVKMLLPGAEVTSEDAADALAVAICHAHHR